MPDDNKKKKYEYKYPKEELDKILDQILHGIQPLVSDDMLMELDIRQKERTQMLRDDDELELDDPLIEKYQEKLLKEQLARDKRRASTVDVMELTISDEQKQKIREQMSESIVRPNPNDRYNVTDDQLFRNKETKEVMEKLKSIKNCYYNQIDFVNAIKIINEAIEFSLGKTGHGDYPWMSYDEAVKEYNAGKIKFNYCEIPHLIINRVTPVGDPEILKGVVNGDVMILNRADDEDSIRKINRRKNANYKPINVDYTVESNTSYQQMLAAHKAGYDTPWSTAIKYKTTSYDPSAMPFASIFGLNRNINNGNEPLLFDWSKEGAGEEYYNMLHGKKTSSNDITYLLNENNGGIINSSITTNMNSFLSSMANTNGNDRSGGYNYNLPNFAQPSENPLQFNEDAASIERSLLASITMNNPIR